MWHQVTLLCTAQPLERKPWDPLHAHFSDPVHDKAPDTNQKVLQKTLPKTCEMDLSFVN